MPRIPSLWLLLGAAIVVAGLLSWFHFPTEWRVVSLGDEAVAADELSGVVIRPEDIPRDERGRPRPELVLDLPAPEPMKVEIKARVDELRERRRRESASVPRGYFATRVAPPPPEADAPPRMDSGDPNPDRVAIYEPPEG